jgi:predicted lipid-binding transport protein (Tim44 family)
MTCPHQTCPNQTCPHQTCPRRRLSKFFDGSIHGGLIAGLIGFASGAALLGGTGVAHSGPCTAQIVQLQQQIAAAPPGPQTGPTFSQTLGAQLHQQPTPADVAHAERAANKEAKAALDAAKKADAAGDAAGCNAALKEAKRLYDIDQ